MGSSTAQVSSPQTSSGKGGPMQSAINQVAAQTIQKPAPAPTTGKGGNVTYPRQGGQPQMGAPNPYSNTVGPWDNAYITPTYQNSKGKGA